MGKMVFTIIGTVAELQHSLIRQSVVMGLDRARKQGKKLGRPNTRVDADEVHQLRANGKSLRNIAEILGIPHTLVARLLRTSVVRG